VTDDELIAAAMLLGAEFEHTQHEAGGNVWAAIGPDHKQYSVVSQARAARFYLHDCGYCPMNGVLVRRPSLSR
jgi:hypothetical protein